MKRTKVIRWDFPPVRKDFNGFTVNNEEECSGRVGDIVYNLTCNNSLSRIADSKGGLLYFETTMFKLSMVEMQDRCQRLFDRYAESLFEEEEE